MASQPPKDFFEQFLVNSAPGQNRSEKAARLFFPDYPNIPGDDDEIPTDSHLMNLLRENLPSMRPAAGHAPVRSLHRRKGKGRKGDCPDVAPMAHDYDNVDEPPSERIGKLSTLMSTIESRQDQKLAEIQSKRDHQRWLYTQKNAESQRQRDHEIKMEVMKMDMEQKWMDHNKEMIENEIRKMQVEIELQQLKIQELKMRREMGWIGEDEQGCN
ncbi:hypothetical protein L210DRAFT_3645624 [Boletus edulis BED1]|uniref:Uncharacterized protein n=1 Tax=Boletus edulis BED1 TaxID=1328754 RepID=A0AAD4BUU5_BOLED|nr:hypothetical protein L210DRAFT_3645624 [Boletus edulis BED1]